MSSRTYGYNNPQLAQAAASLASMFAPPSAQDVYAGAKAAETRAKMQRLADLWQMAQAGGDRGVFDRSNIAVGNYNPSQSYEAVYVKDATDRRGQDIESGDKRYATDVGAKTEIDKANIADITNRRGQDIESGDKRYATDVGAKTEIDKTKLTEQGATTRKMLEPVGPGGTRFVPPSIASMYEVPPTQIGVIEMKPGEQSHLPDGRVIAGPPKPPTETEVKARAFEGMSPEEQRAITFGNTPVVETPKGPMTRPQQLQTGTPALNDKAPQVFNSQNGPVRWDPATNGYVSAQTGQPVDVSGGLQAPSAVQSKDPLGPTTANATEANKRSAEDTVALNTLDLYETLIRNNPGAIGIVGAIRGVGQNAVASAQDLAAAFGAKAPEMKQAAESVRAGLSGVAPELFDPAIPEAQFLQGTLAYAIARTENPSGEVSRQAYERAYERVQGGGLLANQQSALAQIATFRKVLQAKQAGTDALRKPGAARTDTGYRPPVSVQTKQGTVTITPVE